MFTELSLALGGGLLVVVVVAIGIIRFWTFAKGLIS